MSDLYGSQGIGCNVTSCSYFKDSQCTLNNIQVGASTNASNGIAEDETLCLSYKRREDKPLGKSLDNADNMSNVNNEGTVDSLMYTPVLPL